MNEWVTGKPGKEAQLVHHPPIGGATHGDYRRSGDTTCSVPLAQRARRLRSESLSEPMSPTHRPSLCPNRSGSDVRRRLWLCHDFASRSPNSLVCKMGQVTASTSWN